MRDHGPDIHYIRIQAQDNRLTRGRHSFEYDASKGFAKATENVRYLSSKPPKDLKSQTLPSAWTVHS